MVTLTSPLSYPRELSSQFSETLNFSRCAKIMAWFDLIAGNGSNLAY